MSVARLSGRADDPLESLGRDVASASTEVGSPPSMPNVGTKARSEDDDLVIERYLIPPPLKSTQRGIVRRREAPSMPSCRGPGLHGQLGALGTRVR